MSDDPQSPAAPSAGYPAAAPPALPEASEPFSPDDPASTADGAGGEGGVAPVPRGFLGRLLGAFSADAAEPGGQLSEGAAAALAAPSLHNLRRLRVDDVAIPKSDIVAASVSSSLDGLLEMFREHGFSRLPVFRGSLDTPLGLIHLKDLALKYGFGQPPQDFAIRPLLRPLLYVPPSMAIGVLLQQMQLKRIHMALVIDEYGGVDGLVTLEDLVEQVIGEIEDEHDEIETGHWVVERPGQWLIEGKAELDDVEGATGLRLALEGDGEAVDTIGGLISLMAGRVPAAGEVIDHPSGARFEVVEADNRRIKTLRLRFPGLFPRT